MSDVMVLFYKKFGEILSRAAATGGQCKEPEALPGHLGFDPRRPQYFRDTVYGNEEKRLPDSKKKRGWTS
jgi:hypothetical protein